MYPISDSLRAELDQINEDHHPGSRLPDSITTMIGAVYEYEHGSVDAVDVFNPDDIEWLEQNLTKEIPDNLLLRMMAAVVQEMGTIILMTD